MPGAPVVSSNEEISVKRLFTLNNDLKVVLALLGGEPLAQEVKSPYINAPIGVIQTAVGWDLVFPKLFDLTLQQLRLHYMNHLPEDVLARVIKETAPALLCTFCFSQLPLRRQDLTLIQLLCFSFLLTFDRLCSHINPCTVKLGHRSSRHHSPRGFETRERASFSRQT